MLNVMHSPPCQKPYFTNRNSRAVWMACERLRTSSLAMTFLRWNLIVFSVTKRRLAISLLEMPSQRKPRTSCSRYSDKGSMLRPAP